MGEMGLNSITHVMLWQRLSFVVFKDTWSEQGHSVSPDQTSGYT